MLDFLQLGPDIAGLGEQIAEERRKRDAALDEARAAFAAMPPRDELLALFETSKTSWLQAYPAEEPTAVFTSGEVPDDYTAGAADGSQIVPGRHEPLPYYIINVGSVLIRYGEKRASDLSSVPKLGDLGSVDDGFSVRGMELRREPFVAGERLSAEMGALHDMAQKTAAPAVLFFDGSLIFWSLEHSRPPERRKAIMEKLFAFFRSCEKSNLLPAGYISYPGSRDVINNLALLSCDQLPADCDRCRRERPDPATRPCSRFAALTDGDLFAGILEKGQRSAVFENRDSNITREYEAIAGEGGRIRYFYLRNDYEVARVEFPAALGDAPETIGMLHSLILDQCVKGKGYPRALALAHEYALVSGAEARAFRELVEAKALPRLPSPKERAKRRRGI